MRLTLNQVRIVQMEETDRFESCLVVESTELCDCFNGPGMGC